MIRVAGIQISPIFLDAKKTWEKLADYIREAQSEDTRHDHAPYAEFLKGLIPLIVSGTVFLFLGACMISSG